MAQINPTNSSTNTLSADGSLIYLLQNNVQGENYYTVDLYNNFGGGTVTVFTNPQGAEAARLGTTYDVPVKENGVAISETTAASFNITCNSDSNNPTALKIKLATSTSPNFWVKVCNAN